MSYGTEFSRFWAVSCAATAAVLIALTGCSPVATGEPATVPPASTPAPTADPDTLGPVQPVGTPRTVATGLDLPWALVRIDGDGGEASTLVSERDTALVKEVSDSGEVRVVGTVPGVVPGGEGGLLGLAVSPDEPGWLYAYTTTATDNRVVRVRLVGEAGSYALGAPDDVITGIPKAGNHNGGRLKFGPDGMLYVTTGDAWNTANSQDPSSLGGKILRLTPAGEVPGDNPVDSSPVFSLGHRNPQGIAWDRDGRLWAAEFGQNTWDEFNLITAGGNYGWPIVEGAGDNPDFVNPVHQWPTSEASPSGLLWTRDTFFLAALRGERLWAIYPTPSTVGATPWFVGEYGRMRDVIDGPTGTIWVITNNTGREPRDGDDRILEIRVSELVEG